MSLKFITRASALIALVGLAALCIFLYLVVGTTQGSRWLLLHVDSLSDDWSISSENISGSLLHGLTLNRLSFTAAESVSVDIDTLHFQWHPESLLRGTASISPLKAEGIEVVVKPSDKASVPGGQTLVNLQPPIGIAVKNAGLQDITVKTNRSTFHLETVELEKASLARTLHVRQLHLDAGNASFSAIRGKVSAIPPYKGHLEVAWRFGQARGRALMRGDVETLDFEHRLTSPVNVESHGVLHSGLPARQPPHLTVENKISNAQWAYGQDQSVRIPFATVTLQGWLDRYSLQVNGKINTTGLPEVEATLEGNGNLDSLQVKAFTLQGLGGSLSGTGQLSRQPTTSWDLQLQAQNINPGVYWKAWPGNIAMQGGVIKGEYISDTLNTSLSIDSVSGTLRNYPLQASGDVSLTNGLWSGRKIQPRLGKNRIMASGSIGNIIAAKWDIQAPNLTALWPALYGQLAGQGTLEGTASRLNLKGRLQAEKLEYQNYSAGLIDFSATSDIDRGTPNPGFKHSVRVYASDLRINGFPVSELKSELAGSLDNHEIMATLTTQYGELDLHLSGHWQARQWQATLQRARVSDTPAGAWMLQSPSSLLVSSDTHSLTGTCWQQSQAEVCLSGDFSDHEMNIDASLRNVPLSLANPWLPTNLEINGRLDGRLQAKGSLQEPAGTLVLQPEDGYFLVKQVDDDPELYSWRDGSLRVDFSGGRYHLTAGLQLPDRGELSASLQLDSQKQLGGDISLHFTRLAWLEAWAPPLRNIQGAFDAELRLAGTLEQPIWLGEARLHEAAATIPALDIELNEVNAMFRGTGGNHLSIMGSAKSGPGQIRLEGRLDKASGKPWRLGLDIEGKRFEVINTPEVQALVSPDLNVNASRELIHVEGSIALPEVDIQLKSLPNRAVKVSEDVVMVNKVETAAEQATGIPVKTNIKLVLGDRVHFNGFGFEAQLSGNLEVIEEPAQPTLAYGVLNIDEGHYNAYGQNLTVERGKLIFQGPYDNPGLDIRAVRKTPDATVGLNIGGTLKNIRSTAFSEPALPESEAVAILLTGKPLSRATKSDANLLVNAIASLGIKKSAPITSQLSETFGLDVLTIESESDLDQSALTIGKYLTPRLYVRYAIGLFDQISKLALEYRLTENVIVEAQSGKSQSMDIIYRIER